MLELVLYIVETALAIVAAQVKGKQLDIPEALVRIIRAGYQAYLAHTGEPLDPAKMKPFEPIPG